MPDLNQRELEGAKLSALVDELDRNVLRKVVIYPQAPTKNTMKANTIAYYNNELYWKFGNNLCFKITLTAVA